MDFCDSIFVTSVGYDQRLSVWEISTIITTKKNEDTNRQNSALPLSLRWKFGSVCIIGDVGGMAVAQVNESLTLTSKPQVFRVAVVGEGAQIFTVDLASILAK